MDIKAAISSKFVKKDTIDHIWVSPFGGANIGKYASLDWRHKFFVPQMGNYITAAGFAAWVMTGEERCRSEAEPRIAKLSGEDLKLFKEAMFAGKYYQLCALRSRLEREKELLELPWYEYRQYATGVKDFHNDRSRTEIVKAFVSHIVENGNRAPFDNEKYNLSFNLKEVMSRIIAKVKADFADTDEEEVTSAAEEVTEEVAEAAEE